MPQEGTPLTPSEEHQLAAVLRRYNQAIGGHPPSGGWSKLETDCRAMGRRLMEAGMTQRGMRMFSRAEHAAQHVGAVPADG